MSQTRRDQRVAAYENFGRDLGIASTALAIDTEKLTDILTIGNLNFGTNELLGRWIYLPRELGANRVKAAGTVSGHYLYHADFGPWGSLISDANVNWELLHRKLHPDTFNRIIREALELIDDRCDEYMTDVVDGSMNDPDATAWQAGVAGMDAPIKVNGEESVQTGFWALRVTSHAANDYANNATPIRPGPNTQRWAGAFSIVQQGGPAFFQVWDFTHDVLIAERISDGGLNAQRLDLTFSVPEGCSEIEYRLGGVAANSIIDWDGVASHGLNDRSRVLPAYINQQRRLVDVVRASYNTQAGAGVYNVSDRRLETFQRGVLWDTENRGEQVNPNKLVFHGTKPLPATELIIQARRPWWDKGPLDSETATTNAPEDELKHAVWYLLGLYMSGQMGERNGQGKWGSVAATYKSQFNYDLVTNIEPAPPPAVQYFGFTRGPRGAGRGGFGR